MLEVELELQFKQISEHFAYVFFDSWWWSHVKWINLSDFLLTCKGLPSVKSCLLFSFCGLLIKSLSLSVSAICPVPLYLFLCWQPLDYKKQAAGVHIVLDMHGHCWCDGRVHIYFLWWRIWLLIKTVQFSLKRLVNACHYYIPCFVCTCKWAFIKNNLSKDRLASDKIRCMPFTNAHL